MRCAARAISPRALAAVAVSMRPAALALFTFARASFSSPVSDVAGAPPASVRAAASAARQARPLTGIGDVLAANRLVATSALPLVEQPFDVHPLCLVELHHRDDAARL